LIRIKAGAVGIVSMVLPPAREQPMPMDTIITVLVVVAGFSAFAITLYWGERRTRNIGG